MTIDDLVINETATKMFHLSNRHLHHSLNLPVPDNEIEFVILQLARWRNEPINFEDVPKETWRAINEANMKDLFTFYEIDNESREQIELMITLSDKGLEKGRELRMIYDL